MTEMPAKWRTKVEVFIQKNNKLLVGKRKSPYSDKSILVPVSGGVDDCEDMFKAAKRESLEEIGVMIKNVRMLVPNPFEIDWYSKENQFLRDQPGVKKRLSEFRGVRNYFLLADFDIRDSSIYNSGGDGMELVEISKEDLILNFKEEAKTFFPELMNHKVDLLNLI